MNKLKKSIFLFIVGFFSCTSYITNLNAKLCSTPSLPSSRAEQHVPGTLHELIIASGYFILENLVNELIRATDELIFIRQTEPTRKKHLKKWSKINRSKIKELTLRIGSINEQIKSFACLYKNIATQPITNVQKNELERIVEISLQSVCSIARKTIDILEQRYDDDKGWILTTLESQKIILKTIAEDMQKRDWTTVSLPDLRKDTSQLIYLLIKDLNEVICEIFGEVNFRNLDILECQKSYDDPRLQILFDNPEILNFNELLKNPKLILDEIEKSMTDEDISAGLKNSNPDFTQTLLEVGVINRKSFKFLMFYNSLKIYIWNKHISSTLLKEIVNIIIKKDPEQASLITESFRSEFGVRID